MGQTITDFLCMSDNDMFDFLMEFLDTLPVDVSTDGENYIYATRPGSKTCLVAHIDTVCRNGFKRIVRKGDILSNANGILGADDRAGIFAIYRLATMTDQPFDILFTNYEETGGKGVDRFVSDYEHHDFQYRMFIELDRAGCMEYVTYSCIEKECHDWAKSFGLRESHGTFSDIAVLSSETEIPSINLATGYYGQHTVNETLDIRELSTMIDVCKAMIEKPIDALYPCSERYKNTFVSYGSNWDLYYGKRSFDAYGRKTDPSVYVDDWEDEDVLIDDEGYVVDKNGNPVYCPLCGQPLEFYADYCENCGSWIPENDDRMTG